MLQTPYNESLYHTYDIVVTNFIFTPEIVILTFQRFSLPGHIHHISDLRRKQLG